MKTRNIFPVYKTTATNFIKYLDDGWIKTTGLVTNKLANNAIQSK